MPTHTIKVVISCFSLHTKTPRLNKLLSTVYIIWNSCSRFLIDLTLTLSKTLISIPKKINYQQKKNINPFTFSWIITVTLSWKISQHMDEMINMIFPSDFHITHTTYTLGLQLSFWFFIMGSNMKRISCLAKGQMKI